jgi:two-component system response regulator FixJ
MVTAVSTERNIVAIVDDDDAARDALQFLLTVLGRQPRGYASPTAFLEAQTNDVGCLVLDHHMPDMTGLDLAQHLRSINDSTPIMLITGALTEEISTRAIAIGVDVVCEKPPQPGLIAEFVHRSLERLRI